MKKIRVWLNFTTGRITDRGVTFGSECVREYDFDSHDFEWSNGMLRIYNEYTAFPVLLVPMEKLNYLEVVDEDAEAADT